MNRSTLLGFAPTVALATFVLAAAALADPVRLISRSSDQFGTGDSASAALLWDQSGRFAIFVSAASNLVTGQSTGGFHLFHFDRLTGTTRLVSHIPGSPTVGANQGVVFNGLLGRHSISADGKWVAYTSASTDLVSGQVDSNTSDGFDVFLWNRDSDSTLLVSRAAGSAVTAGDRPSFSPSFKAVSSDGRYVVFESSAANLVADQQGTTEPQVFQFDRLAGLTVMVSHAFNLPARSANGTSFAPTVSTDGRWVAFGSLANNLIDDLDEANVDADIFLWDRDAGFATSLRLISRKQGFPTTTGNSGCTFPSISADGTGLVFISASTNLEGVTSDTNGVDDAFHYDRPADVLSLVSHRSGSPTETANGFVGGMPALSDNGDWVAFQSTSTNHVFLQDDSNGVLDVFLWNGPITLVSHSTASLKTTGNGASVDPILTSDGNGVAFSSRATDLVAGVTDSNNGQDVFAFRRDSGLVSLVSHVPDETQTGNDQRSSATSIALGGRLIGFSSSSSDLVSDDDNASSDVFFHDTTLFADGFESGDLAAWSLHVP